MYKPSEIFAEILRSIAPENFGGNTIAIHKFFYGLQNNYPEIMEGFKFRKRINPFCLTLEDLLLWFQLDGILELASCEKEIFKINTRKLNKSFPLDTELFNIFSKMSELKVLYI